MTNRQKPHNNCHAIQRLLIVFVISLGVAGRGHSADAGSLATLAGVSGFSGGLLVYVGNDLQPMAALVEQCPDSSLILGLSDNQASVASARRILKQRGVYGRVTVSHWTGVQLPLIDNLVNVLIVDTGVTVPQAEVTRVLTPAGTAQIRTADRRWRRLTKPRPSGLDDWTHYLHDATNNAVGRDAYVGPPRRMQWVGSPRWSRHHEHMSSMNALVSDAGRLFYVFDEAPALSNQLASAWKLIARDAFNGVVLWKRSIPTWHNYRWPLKSGPAQLPRRLVAVNNTVYATLSYQGPVEALDALTGKTIHVFETTKGTEELLVSDDVLFAMVNPSPVDYSEYTYDTKNAVCWVEKSHVAERYSWNEKPRKIQAIDIATNRLLWESESPVVPLSMAVDGGKVYFCDGLKLIALDRQTGDRIWESSNVGRKKLIPTSFGATLLVYGGVVMFTGGDGKMSAHSADTGKQLWMERQPPTGHNSPLDILAIGGLIWNAAIAGGRHDGVFRGRDPRTGKVVREFPPDVNTYWFHHRCYRARATDRYLLTSRTGVEFVDLETEHWDINHWVRGACLYGIMPCNGLLYAPQHPCICYAEAKLNGFCALAPTSETRPSLTDIDDRERLIKGPAYGAELEPAADSSSWPTYRHDAARSGAASTAVGSKLTNDWTANIGGRLSGVTVAAGRLFVASIDTHTLYALDAATGQSAWTFTANGRIDSPPTFDRGQLLFGSNDGYVYCLRASDGQLSWRFRAAPLDRRLMSFEQLESVWPVHGAVLVHNDVAYCVAGRSMFLDGGLRLLRLDPRTGKKLSETVLDSTDPTTDKTLQNKIRDLNMPVALPDVLACDGKYVYMRSQAFDLNGVRSAVPTPDDDPTRYPSHQLGETRHLFCPTGLLDDSWFHRSYWMYGKTFSSGCNYWFRAGRFTPAGRLLVFDDHTVYGFGRQPNLFVWTPALEYHLFAASKSVDVQRIQHVVEANARMDAADKWAKMNRFITTAAPKADMSAVAFDWSQPAPDLLVRAMVLADGKLFVAGPPDVVDEEAVFQNPFAPRIQEQLAKQGAAFQGLEGGILNTVDAKTGSTLSTNRLTSPPVWDGMVAADKHLYVATVAGKVVCFAGDQ